MFNRTWKLKVHYHVHKSSWWAFSWANWIQHTPSGGSFKIFQEYTLYLRNTEYYNHSTWISFKIFPLCNYTLVPTTVKILETFLRAILWKTFQLFHRILNGVRSVTKAPPLPCWFHSREQVKISSSHVRRVRGNAWALSHYSLLWNPWPIPTGVQEHCRERETNCWFFICFWVFLPDCIPKAMEDVSVHFFIHSSNSCNYTSEFRERFQDTTYFSLQTKTQEHNTAKNFPWSTNIVFSRAFCMKMCLICAESFYSFYCIISSVWLLVSTMLPEDDSVKVETRGSLVMTLNINLKHIIILY
jgi:hypothetical protein